MAFGDHFSDALRYGLLNNAPLPSTATQIKMQQQILEATLAKQAKALGVLIDNSTLDAMKAMTGTTSIMEGAQMKVNVGANPFFAANNINPMNLLAARLRVPMKQGVEGAYWFEPLDYVHIVFDDEKAYVMYVAHGKASVIEDDAKNFPTDELVAQFRLLLASQ